MKMRMIVIEADGVESWELQEILAKAFPRLAAASPAAMPEALPEEDEPAAQPSKPKARLETPEELASHFRQRVAEQVQTKDQCRQCGYEPPPEQDLRMKCPKCNSKAWEKVEIPAKVEVA